MAGIFPAYRGAPVTVVRQSSQPALNKLPRTADRLETMTSPLRLAAFDIDGTLMPSSGTAMREHTMAVLRSAAEAGVEVEIATGRRAA